MVVGLNGLPKSPLMEITRFYGNSATNGQNWYTYVPPVGKSMISIFLVSSGGNGGTGVVGANSVSAGGGGGGSSGQTIVTMPLDLLFQRGNGVLYISLAYRSVSAALSYVAVRPTTTANATVAIAQGGAVGGNAAAGTGGTAGTAGAIATAALMPLGFNSANVLAGQAGIAGGAAIAGAALTLPVTGLRVTGGTGGGGLPAAAAAGTNGGSFTVPAQPTPFPAHAGGVGSATATNPANNGRQGYQVTPAGLYFYGGTGAASTHGTATGGGLVQGQGGNGAFGCGGGGMGGALTGSAASKVAIGGGGFCEITVW